LAFVFFVLASSAAAEESIFDDDDDGLTLKQQSSAVDPSTGGCEDFSANCAAYKKLGWCSSTKKDTDLVVDLNVIQDRCKKTCSNCGNPKHDGWDFNPVVESAVKEQAFSNHFPQQSNVHVCPQLWPQIAHIVTPIIQLCKNADPDVCRNCVETELIITKKDAKFQWKNSRCVATKASSICNAASRQIRAAADRAARRNAYVQPPFRPKAGFGTSWGEMGACILGKAEAIADTLYTMSHCSAYDQPRGEDCFKRTAKDLSVDIRQCCAGNEHLVLSASEAECDMAVAKVSQRIRDTLAVEYGTCTKDGDKCRSRLMPMFKTCMIRAKSKDFVGLVRSSCDAFYKFGGVLGTFKEALKAANKMYAHADPSDKTKYSAALLKICNSGNAECSQHLSR
jgi:hypothetical protein